MEQWGLTAERNIDIVGFGNVLRYVTFMKPICSIDPHLEEEARVAVDLIRSRIHDPALPPQQITLPVSLVCRHEGNAE